MERGDVLALDLNAPVFYVRASGAAICAEPECDAVFVLARGECPACGSRNWLPLSRVTGARRG